MALRVVWIGVVWCSPCHPNVAHGPVNHTSLRASQCDVDTWATDAENGASNPLELF